MGFQGKSYRTVQLGTTSYGDIFRDYLDFIGPRLEQAHRLLTQDGTLYFHIDYREAHYCKVLLDQIFGRHCFINEIIWAYDYGGRSKRKWPAKHDTILVYVKDPKHYFFDQDAIGANPIYGTRLGFQGEGSAGQTTDRCVVAYNRFLPTAGRRLDMPLRNRREFCAGSCWPHRKRETAYWIFFAGSGTTAAAAQKLNRRFVMIDSNEEAISVMV